MKQLIIKSSCNYTLKAYTAFLKMLFKKQNLSYSIFYLPLTERKITLLKSPHVNKKAKEQFKIATYKAVVSLNSPVFSTQFSSLILNKPKAILLKLKS